MTKINFQIMQQILNSIKNNIFILQKVTITQMLLYSLIGILFSAYIIYIRLILKRIPRDIFSDLSNLRLSIYFGIFILFLITTFVYSRYLYKEYIKSYKNFQPKETIFKALIEKIKTFLFFLPKLIDKSLVIFDRIFKFLILDKLFSFRIDFWINPLIRMMDQSWKYRKSGAWIFIIVPRIIIISCLFIDVFYYEKFHYIYLCGPLFIFILLYDYILNSIINFIYDWFRLMGTRIKGFDPRTKEYISLNELVNIFLKESINRVRTQEFTEVSRTFGYTYIDQEKFMPIIKDIDPRKEPAKYLEIIVKDISKFLNILDTLILLKIYKEIQIEYFKLCIYIMYSLIWGYIFITSALMCLI